MTPYGKQKPKKYECPAISKESFDPEAELHILNLIVVREAGLVKLRKVCEWLAREGITDSKTVHTVRSLILELRNVTVEIIERIASWRRGTAVGAHTLLSL